MFSSISSFSSFFLSLSSRFSLLHHLTIVGFLSRTAPIPHGRLPRLETVLAWNIPVLIYSGQLDVIIGAALTERFLPGVVWVRACVYVDVACLRFRCSFLRPAILVLF
jgi:hypothetical protein